MKKLKCLLENFGCRRIKVDADRVLNRFISRRSDIASPEFLVRTILRFLRAPTFLSGRYSLILILYFLLAPFSFAQTPEWVYQYVNPQSSEYPNSIITDNSGNVYVTGCIFVGSRRGLGLIQLNGMGVNEWFYFDDTLGWGEIGCDMTYAFNNVFLTGGTGSFMIVLCVDTLGQGLWLYRDSIAAEGRSIAVSSSHHIYVCGIKYPSPSDWVVVKLDSLGNECWRYVYDGPAGSYDEATSIIVDRNENIYVGGYSTGFGTSTDFTVLKLDSAGHLVWEYRYDGPANYRDELQAMALDTFGNIYIAGSSRGVGWDFCVVKIDSSGQEEWVYRYNGLANAADLLYDLTVDDSGNVYVSGLSGTTSNDTLQLFTLIKVDSGGSEHWCYIDAGPAGYKGGIAHRIEVDGLGGIYGAGFLRNMGDITQIAVVKLNSSGDLLWWYIYPHNPPWPWADVTHDMVVDVYGNVYHAGRICVSSGNDDIVVMKFASSQGVVKEVMKNEIRDKEKGATIFKGGIEFLPDEDCGLRIYDVSGRMKVEKTFQRGKKEYIPLQPGVYFLRVEGKDDRIDKKVIVF